MPKAGLNIKLRLFQLLLIGVLVLLGVRQAPSQVRPVYSLGAAGLSQALLRLQTTASALHTGAHPDDEDSAFIARTARGDHARVGYLSLNRGEGGQNIIGPELTEALGIIRTEELLQARQLDGGLQFFTRAIDYGFSKTRAEASIKWNEQAILEDLVRVIRTFRPLVVYSRFTGTPMDGHGHHQLAGYLTPLAVEAAADPSQFSEQIFNGLQPWQVKKLYSGVGFRPDPENLPTLHVQTGDINPVIGRTYSEIANEGRSQHKSQRMGVIETRGPRQSTLKLMKSLVPTPETEASVFDGIDTTVTGISVLAGLPGNTLQNELQEIEEAANLAVSNYNPLNPGTLVSILTTGLQTTRLARQALEHMDLTEIVREETDFLLNIKENDFRKALIQAGQVVIDPLIEQELLSPGESTSVTVRTFLPPNSPFKIINTVIEAPQGWGVILSSKPIANTNDSPFSRFFTEIPSHANQYTVTVPTDAPPTQPYFLELPRSGDRYQLRDQTQAGMPFSPPILQSIVTLEVGGIQVKVSKPVQYRFADSVRGELRRLPMVVPTVVVGLDSKLLIVPLEGFPNEQEMTIRVQSFTKQPVTGTLNLKLPEGWEAIPANEKFYLQSKGEQTSVTFLVRAPASRISGSFSITAEATIAQSTYKHDLQVIEYPHIQTHRIYWPAKAAAKVINLEVAQVNVGYIMGSGDQIPEALSRMGINVSMLDENFLTSGNLSTFDTIVVGVRASEARPDFIENHKRLMEYVNNGGNLIVQYQQTNYVSENLPPFPAKMRSRVTDETAPVQILAPDHQVFTFPNHITSEDFDGWTQERNLYAFTTFDDRYKPLLQTADPGENPQQGGQVYAKIGKGHYIYTAYAWFRQLPAGVPGAYRMFANLISLPKAPQP